MQRIVTLVLVFVVFSIYTAAVAAGHGYFGFLSLALAEPWAGQMLADLAIALTLFIVWMVRDARSSGVPAWPYAVATLLLGSIGALAYLLHREAKRLGQPSVATQS